MRARDAARAVMAAPFSASALRGVWVWVCALCANTACSLYTYVQRPLQWYSVLSQRRDVRATGAVLSVRAGILGARVLYVVLCCVRV
jgi:hypothetical protein